MAEHPLPTGDQQQEARMLRDSIRGFMARELTEARIADCEAAGDLPWEIVGALREFGYLGGLLPEQAVGTLVLMTIFFAPSVYALGFGAHAESQSIN